MTSDRVTPLRQLVLAAVARSTKPPRACDVLALVQAKRSTAALMSVYRVLEWLEERGQVRRIVSMRAFFACTPDQTHQQGLFICTRCFRIEPFECDIAATLSENTVAAGFAVRGSTVEILGTCAACCVQLGERSSGDKTPKPPSLSEP